VFRVSISADKEPKIEVKQEKTTTTTTGQKVRVFDPRVHREDCKLKLGFDPNTHTHTQWHPHG